MLEIESAKPGATDAFWKTHDRDRRSELWSFRVVWHEQTHDLIARDGAAQKFFLACGYAVEAVIPQHTFKLDVALLRKFLL